MTARVQALPDPPATDVELDALVMNLKDVAKRVIKLMPELPKEASALVDSVTEPGQLADLITSNLDVQVDEKQDVLETFDLKTRMRKVLQFLSRQHEVLKVREKINSQVQEEMGRNQREYVLRQQLKAIKEELGELDEGGGDLDEFAREDRRRPRCRPRPRRSRIKQLERLKGMQPSSAEYTVTRTYLEWLVELPWSNATEDKLDIEDARDDPRRRSLRPREGEEAHPRVPGGAQAEEPTRRGRSSASSGPPGVGKTSLGRVDRARRSGASSSASRWAACATRRRSAATGAPTSARCPGRIIQGMKKAGTEQPGLHARRDRQARRRLPRRPGGGAARGARPRAEQHLPRSLPRGAVRPLEGHVHRDGEHAGPDPAGAARPLEVLELPGYTREEKLHDRASSYLVPKQLERARPRRASSIEFDRRRRSTEIIEQLHARGGRAQPRARDRPTSAAAIAVQGGRGQGQPNEPITRRAASPRCLGPQKFYSEVGGAHGRARAWRRAWPGRRPAATSSSSRRRRCPARGSWCSPASSAT